MTPADTLQALFTRAQITRRHQPADILGPRREAPLVLTRFAIITHFSDAHPDITVMELGRIFHRDHTAICYARRRARELLSMLDRAYLRAHHQLAPTQAPQLTLVQAVTELLCDPATTIPPAHRDTLSRALLPVA